jgi:hypothetical protein
MDFADKTAVQPVGLGVLKKRRIVDKRRKTVGNVYTIRFPF